MDDAPRLGILSVTADLLGFVRGALPPGHAIVGEGGNDGSVRRLLIEGPHMPPFPEGSAAAVVNILFRREDGPPMRCFARWEHRPADEWEVAAEAVAP